MGMFDTIKFKAPLPGYPDGYPGDFQTKGLGNQLFRFTVNEMGQLLRDEDQTEHYDWAEEPHPEEPTQRATNYSGEIEIHDIIDDVRGDPNSGGTWLSYLVNLEQGRMTRATLVERYHRDEDGERVDTLPPESERTLKYGLQVSAGRT